MWVIVGLGNPGSEYENTRHNLGFAVINAIAEEIGIALAEGKGNYLIGEKKISGTHIVLVKPLTYMNNSGTAVKEILEHYNLNNQDLFVIADDFYLPLGTMRIRLRGGSGGHNGLYSIIYHLQSEAFIRFRCGIGNESIRKHKQDMADFVLSPFNREERIKVQKVIDHTRDAVLTALTENIQTVMSRYNNYKF